MIPARCLILPGPLSRQVTSLWNRQAAEWPLLAEGIASLHAARTRSIPLGETQLTVQCNPARSSSAAARTDPASVAARPCFLCPDRLPEPQRAIAYGQDWLILCNPAPIFEPHFTITCVAHRPQRVDSAIGPLLDLARDLGGAYTVFYNGPSSGASAPDHLHLQATPAGAMPFERALAKQLCGSANCDGQQWIEWVRADEVRVGTTRPRRSPAVILVGASHAQLARSLQAVVAAVGEVCPADPEPMLNLFAAFAEGRWIVWLFPRTAHRPSCYGDGPGDFLISPGAIDLAGLLITPRPEDFDRLDGATVQSIFAEVLPSPSLFARLRERLAAGL